MAKIYGEIAASALMTFDKSFARSNGQPLDSTEIYYSKAAAETYAAGDVAYVGQKIAVIEEVDGVKKLTHYGIEPDNSLKELGSSPVGDESTIVVAEDGTVSLAGIDGLEFIEKNDAGEDVSITYQPLLTSAGLTWVKPSATTVEGLATEIEGLKTRMATLETTIGDDEAGLVKDVADIDGRVTAIEDDYLVEADKTELQGNIDKKADKIAVDNLTTRVGNNESAITTLNANSETAGSVDYKIAQAVAAIMENPDETMNSINELVTWINNHATDALALSNQVATNKDDIAALEELVGTTGVAEQITAAIEAALKVEGVDKYALATDLTAAIARIAALEGKAHEHANADVLSGITSDKVTAWDAAAEKAAANETALTGKVDKNGTDRLMTEGEGSKLAGIEAGAQVNKVETVDETHFGLTDRKLTLKVIEMDKVAGLPTALAAKVEAVANHRLMADAEGEKLATIAEGAQVNVIEKIKVGDTELTVGSDKVVKIPGATALALGLVKGSEAENQIKVNDDFTMEINSVNINKLVQTTGDVLILDGGNAAAN